jgi:hypothetical protein
MKRPLRITLLLLTALSSLPAAAALQASLDQDQVAPGESVQLTLQRDGHGDSQPDLSPLKQDFAILSRASGSSIQIINGHLATQMQMRLILAPKHAGRIEIPPLNWDGERSPPLVLNVAANPGTAGSTGNAAGVAHAPAAHVFFTNTLEQKQPYVQAATTLKLQIHADQPLHQASLSFASSNDVVVQQIGKDRQSSEMRDGRNYQVIERDYLLFPQRSGRISLDGPVLDALVADTRSAAPDPFFGQGFGNPFAGTMNTPRPLHLQGDAIVLEVRPRPAGVAGQDWLPAQQVSLEESGRPASGPVNVGEPFTRHLRVSALGLSAAQLPNLAERMPLPDGLKAYPDQPTLNNAEQDGSVSGSREQDIALIASRPGRYQLPAMRLAWWDTVHNSPREAVLPARMLEVLPVAGGSSSAPPAAAFPLAPAAAAPAAPIGIAPIATSGRIASVWPWVSLVLGLLWLTTLIAWWRDRRPASPVQSGPLAAVPGTNSIRVGTARKAFRQACHDNDAAAARRHLLDWASIVWPHDPPAGLNALARRLTDHAVSSLLRELDRACYAGGDWRGEALAQALTILRDASDPTIGKPTELPALYP